MTRCCDKASLCSASIERNRCVAVAANVAAVALNVFRIKIAGEDGPRIKRALEIVMRIYKLFVISIVATFCWLAATTPVVAQFGGAVAQKSGSVKSDNNPFAFPARPRFSWDRQTVITGTNAIVSFWNVSDLKSRPQPIATKVLDIRTPQEIAAKLRVQVQAYNLSPNNHYLAVAVQDERGWGLKPFQQIRIYDTQTLALERTLPVELPDTGVAKIFPAQFGSSEAQLLSLSLFEVAFFGDSSKVFCAYGNGKSTFAAAWDVKSGKLLRAFQVSEPNYGSGFVVFSPAQQTLAFSPITGVRPDSVRQGEGVSLWSMGSGKLLSQVPKTVRVTALSVSLDGATLATATTVPRRTFNNTVRGRGTSYIGGQVLLWDVYTGKLQRKLQEDHPWPIQALAFSDDGKKLATAALGMEFVPLSVSGGPGGGLRQPPGLSKSAKVVATTMVRVWNLPQDTIEAQADVYRNMGAARTSSIDFLIDSLVFAPDGNYLLRLNRYNPDTPLSVINLP